jgi:UDP-N-acetylmuramate--alanine ligase
MDRMKLQNKQILDKQEAIEYIQSTKPELLLTVGAGDIDQLVQPLKTALQDV